MHSLILRPLKLGNMRERHRCIPGLYPDFTRTRQFCDFCKSFVPDPGIGYAFYTHTRGRFMRSVLHHTIPETFCDICTTFKPLPDSSVTSVEISYWYLGIEYAFHTCTRRSSVTSVKNIIPYRKYPYYTEHNLVILETNYHDC